MKPELDHVAKRLPQHHPHQYGDVAETISSSRGSRSMLRQLGGVAGVVVVFVLVFSSSESTRFQRITSSSTTKIKLPSSSLSTSPKAKVLIRTANVESMRSNVQLVRKKFIQESLTVDYGADNVEAIFFTVANNNNETLLGPVNNTPFYRAKRTLMLKVLRALQNSSNIDDYNNNNSSNPASRLVWATAGNSIAAGHGNLYRESYTAVLTRAVTPVLDAASLAFVSRSYGLSGAQSAPECAFCTHALYGNDLDILVWDFSLTDGRRRDVELNKMEWFWTRSAVSSSSYSSTIFLAVNVYDDPGRIAILDSLAARGLTVLYSRHSVWEAAIEGIPATILGSSQHEIDAMPPFVRQFKCGDHGKLEADGTLCLHADKFNPICPKRLFQTNWHPGWSVLVAFSIATKCLSLTGSYSFLCLVGMHFFRNRVAGNGMHSGEICWYCLFLIFG